LFFGHSGLGSGIANGVNTVKASSKNAAVSIGALIILLGTLSATRFISSEIGYVYSKLQKAPVDTSSQAFITGWAPSSPRLDTISELSPDALRDILKHDHQTALIEAGSRAVKE
jgi:hypothetical protein